MNFEQCVETRRSIRKFTTEKVTREDIEKIVKIASFSPSWKNTQVIRYIAIEDEALKNKVANNGMMGFDFNRKTALNAPVLMAVTILTGISGFEEDGSYSTSKQDRWEVFDAGIATQTLSLAIHDMGLGSVIFGVFDENKVQDILGLPKTQKVATLVALGHPDQQPKMPKRKEVSELLTFK